MSDRPLQLLDSLSAWPASPPAARPVPSWTGDEVLADFPTAGSAARAAALDLKVFTALARRPNDTLATTAALSVLGDTLAPIAWRWARAGLRGADLADAEADLITEALAAMRRHPDAGPGELAQSAWNVVSGLRITERRRSRRQVPYCTAHDGRVGPDSLREIMTVLAHAMTAKVLSASAAASLWATACGWTAVELSRTTGCPVSTWRNRRARARRSLVGRLAGDGGG